MPVDAGTSTQLMTVSAVVIAESVPVLEKGDVVDVYVVQGIDYSKGRAPVIVRRVCAARDERCLEGLRKKQDRKVSSMEGKEGNSVAENRKLPPVVANRNCPAAAHSCRGEMASVPQ